MRESNPAIAAARQAAIEVLRPSPRDMEHGLELHRNSLVAESYGLGLHAPVEPDILNAAIEEGASASELQDLIEDHIMTRWTQTPELLQEYREAWVASGVTCTFLNAGEEGNSPLRLLKRLSRYIYLIDAMPGFLTKAISAASIRNAFASGMRGICLATNGVPLPGDQANITDELSQIRIFSRLGVRMMHLTYNRRNPIGDGCGESTDAGLSDFGHAVIAEMNRCGILIDLAHTGRQTSLDACRASRLPVIASHSASHAVHPHIRSKTDEEIRAVVETGGTIGVANVPAFLGGTGDIRSLLDHIDYLAKTFGSESITIGTDAPHRSRDSDRELAGLLPRGPKRPRWESLWPGESASFADKAWRQPCQLQSLAWTNFPLFTVGLVQRGHSDEAIQRIIGENLLRIAAQAWRDCPSTAIRPLTP